MIVASESLAKSEVEISVATVASLLVSASRMVSGEVLPNFEAIVEQNEMSFAQKRKDISVVRGLLIDEESVVPTLQKAADTVRKLRLLAEAIVFETSVQTPTKPLPEGSLLRDTLRRLQYVQKVVESVAKWINDVGEHDSLKGSVLYTKTQQELIRAFKCVVIQVQQAAVIIGKYRDMGDIRVLREMTIEAQDAAESAISHLQNGINCSREEAERLYRTINFFADGVTSDLTYIASSRDDFATKQKAINRTIRDYFENGNSIIQVSSISKDPENPDIFDFTIRRYLYRLANMKNRYTKVELTFQQDYLGMVLFLTLVPLDVLGQIHDWEDFNKTMVAIERINKKKEMSFLNALSDDDFIHSTDFVQLFNIIKSSHLNLGYAQVRCIKEFEMKDSKQPYDEAQSLEVSFLQGNDFRWYVESAYVQSGKDTVQFEQKSFKPLAAEYNFSDFVSAVRNGDIKEYSGITPYGGLPLNFLSSKRVQKNRAATIIITNLIFYQPPDSAQSSSQKSSSQIVEVGYIALKNTTKLQGQKKGWLLHEYGTMGDFYERYMQQDLFHDFLLDKAEQGANHRLNKYNLNKPSRFYFENLRSVHSD